jgi:hypothetical protein
MWNTEVCLSVQGLEFGEGGTSEFGEETGSGRESFGGDLESGGDCGDHLRVDEHLPDLADKQDGTLKNSPTSPLQHTDEISAIRWMPDGSQFLVSTMDCKLTFYVSSPLGRADPSPHEAI